MARVTVSSGPMGVSPGGRRGLALLALGLQLAVLLVWSRSTTDPKPSPVTFANVRDGRSSLGVPSLLPTTRPLPQHSIWRLQAQSIDGDTVELSRFAGRVALVVNVASK